MWYLLKEDVSGYWKILNDKKYKTEKYNHELTDAEMLLVYEEDGRYRDYPMDFNQYFIIKSSEEVFDLIKVGDLIEFVITKEVTHTVQLHDLNDRNEYCRKSDIVAFYKQDRKGNFIRVWRKEDE